MMLDTDREREISLGTRYPYAALSQGEVILHEIWHSQSGYNIGDQIEISFQSKEFWNTVV